MFDSIHHGQKKSLALGVIFFQTRETQKQCSECGEVIAGTYYTLDNDKVRSSSLDSHL